MANLASSQISNMERACESLLDELQKIWQEVGESDEEKDKMLLELERECLEVYRRKVDQANRSRAQLRQVIADSEAELAAICSAMGEPPVHLRQANQNAGSLKEELSAIILQLEEIQKRKNDRQHQFLEVMDQIKKISLEIRPSDYMSSIMAVDESDFTTRRLEELQRQLQHLQLEKDGRLKQVMDHLSTLNSLCLVLGMDFRQRAHSIHPSLYVEEGSKSITDETIESLASGIQRLREVKIERMQKLQDLATTMLELWHLMDTPIEEQQRFQSVTRNIAASEHEIKEPNALSVDFINHVEDEVSRLEALKASKMKELVMKKKAELEELCRRAHLVAESNTEIEIALEATETGAIDPSLVLEEIETQISAAKEEVFSRKEILERVEKWLAACEEEYWLDEYNRDENRYNAGRGTHLALRRAEKARVAVNKIPAIVDSLTAKTMAWEKERGTKFTYDGVQLLSILEDYATVRQEKAQEKKRQRDQRKIQGQLIAEQEVLFGSKPSPIKTQIAKKVPRTPNGVANKRLSMGISQVPKPDTKSTSSSATAGRGIGENPSTPRKPFVPLASDNNFASTPSKHNFTDEEEENQTPTKMHMAATPAPVCLFKGAAMESSEEAEYSFEENRAGFILPKAPLKCVQT